MKRVRHFIAAFAAGGILILALAGLLAVDLRAERDMPDGYGPIFRVSGIHEGGAKLSLLGRDYYLAPELLVPVKEAVWRLRGLLPDAAQGAAYLVGQLIIDN